MPKNRESHDPKMFGDSPLGFNGREATATGFAPIRNTGVIPVELYHDKRVDTDIASFAISELDDKDISLRKGEESRARESIRRSIGIR